MTRKNVKWFNPSFQIAFGSTTYTGAAVPKLTLVPPAAERYVIVVGNREYQGGPGYGGPMCLRAHVRPRTIYADVATADQARVALGRASRAGTTFRIVPWKP